MGFPVSSSLKGMLLKGSPMFCGAMGVSLGGWYTNENVNSIHNQLLSDGYQYKVAKPNLSSQSVKKSEDDWKTRDFDFLKFRNGKCAKTFFPGLEEITWTKEEAYVESYSVEMSNEQNGKSMGCILMESSINSESLKVVKSELTFKRGNRGFILWTGFLSKNDLSYEEIRHYLIYLENKNQKWNVIVGYFITGQEWDTIKSPNSSENWFKANNKTLSYAGIWEESSSGGKAILNDIYGMPHAFTGASELSYFYITSDKKWKMAVTSGGMSAEAATYFPAVLGISSRINGYWTDINSFCWNLSLRNLDLKDLCYEKKQ